MNEYVNKNLTLYFSFKIIQNYYYFLKLNYRDQNIVMEK